MIIVSGNIYLKPGKREEFIQKSIESIDLARKTKGCKDFSVSPDPLDINRVNIYEAWDTREQLDKFRASGPEDDSFLLIESINVKEYEISNNNT